MSADPILATITSDSVISLRDSRRMGLIRQNCCTPLYFSRASSTRVIGSKTNTPLCLKPVRELFAIVGSESQIRVELSSLVPSCSQRRQSQSWIQHYPEESAVALLDRHLAIESNRNPCRPDCVAVSIGGVVVLVECIKGRDSLASRPNVESPSEGEHTWRYIDY